jgi:hypothetical protein
MTEWLTLAEAIELIEVHIGVSTGPAQVALRRPAVQARFALLSEIRNTEKKASSGGTWIFRPRIGRTRISCPSLAKPAFKARHMEAAS